MKSMLDIKNSYFFTLLRSRSGPEGTKLVAACLAAGLMQGLAVFTVLQGLEQLCDTGIRFHTFLAFLVCLGIFYYLFRYMTEHAALIALRGVMEWRMRVATKLRGISLKEYDKLDKGWVQSALVDEREMVVEATRMLMASAASTIMILVSFLKMFTVSVPGALVVIVFLCLGLVIFLRLVHGVYAFMETAGSAETDFSASLLDLQDGFRQLKQHKPKTSDLFANYVMPGLGRAAAARKATERRHALAISFFAVFNLLILGLILFLMPGFLGLDVTATSTILVLSMFSLSPMMSLVGFVPLLTKVEMNLQDLTSLEQRLDSMAEEFEIKGIATHWQHKDPVVPPFESLCLRDVRFDYFDKQGMRVFGIHVDAFVLRRGELVFIRGGNGSGKSTFMNVLSGLYAAQSGMFFCNDRPLADWGMEAYRNLFAVLPSEFHLFRTPLGVHAPADQVEDVLRLMRIESKVSVNQDGSFSTLELSAGQRKRLALACALLEDRDVYLFDEVAADFDPGFRNFFYESLLPDLQRKGKTILAISHDDRYFHIADRVLCMRDGVFTENGHDKEKS